MDLKASPAPVLRGLAESRLLKRTFRSLRHRDYRLYFIGQLVSFTGSWMQSAALMWLAYDLTGDAFWPPLMLVAAVGPTLLLGPFAGVLADRLPKKWLVFATQSGFLCTALLLVGMMFAGLVDPWLLLALQLVNGLVQSFDLPARLAFVPELIPRDDLINAVGLNSLTFNLARALGPALAGIVFGLASAFTFSGASPTFVGAVACFTFNAVSYAAVLVALYCISVGGRGSVVSHDHGHLLDGIRYLVEKPGLGGLVVITGLLSIFAWPVLTMLPAYTTQVLHQREQAYSFLVSALGAGALMGSLVTAAFSTPARRERFLLIGAAAGLVGIVGLLLATQMAFAFVSCGVFGFGLILYLSTGQSTMQLDSPARGRGKVMALWAMTLSGSSIPGHLLSGYAARHFPIADVLLALLLGTAVAAAGVAALVASGKLRSDQAARR